MIRPDDRTPEDRRQDAVDDARPSMNIREIKNIVPNYEPPWEPLSFAPGYTPTPEMEAWLHDVNNVIRDKIHQDMQNIIVYGTTDVRP